jgi:hypothetical protein
MIYLNYKHLYYFQAVAQEGSIAQYYLSQFDLAELDMNKAIERFIQETLDIFSSGEEE